MKLNIIGVPEGYESYTRTEEGSQERELIFNGGPRMQPSIYMSRSQAHQALKNLAIEDKWSALYDPSNPDSLIWDGSSLIGIKDSLGNFPDLTVPEYEYSAARNLLQVPFGAANSIDGAVSTEAPFSRGELTVVTSFNLPDSSHEISNSAFLFVGGNFLDALEGTGEMPPRIQTQILNSPGAYYNIVAGLGEESSVVSSGALQDKGQIFTFNTRTGNSFSGYHPLLPTGEDEDESSSALGMSGIAYGSIQGLLEGGVQHTGSIGPVFIAEGDMPQDRRERAVRMLSQITGSAVGIDPSETRTPVAYSSIEDRSTRTVGYNSQKPYTLASITKMMTIYIARKYVTNSMLDTLVTIEDYPVSSNTPNVYAGDKMTWRDIFYATVLRSHNRISENIALKVGRMIDPSSSDPYQTFINAMNDQVLEWGWGGAVFNRASGFGHNEATPDQINDLMFTLSTGDSFIRTVMGTLEHEFTITRADNSVDTYALSSIVQDHHLGILYFPEFQGGKGGNLTVDGQSRRSFTMIWRNPNTRLLNVATVLGADPATAAGRTENMRMIVDAARRILDTPEGVEGGEGTLVTWGRDSAGPHIIATKDVGFENSTIVVNFFSSSTTVRPTVNKDDILDISVDHRAFLSGGVPVRVRVSVTGGSVNNTSSVTLVGQGGNVWDTISSSVLVTEGGYLNVSVEHPLPSGTGTGLHLRNVSVKVSSDDRSSRVYSLDLEGFTVTESSQPQDSSDSSGSIGEFSVQVRSPEIGPLLRDFGTGFIRNKPVEVETNYGILRGTATGVSESNRHALTISGISEMAPLNSFNVVSPPFSGTLPQLLEEYFGLISSAAPEFSVAPSLRDRRITVPGWEGELWYHLKLLCAAEQIQISVDPEGGVFVSDVNDPSHLEYVDETDVTLSYSDPNLAESVEVYHYGNTWKNEFLVYPPGGWTEELEVLSVNAGETVEQTLELSASLKSFTPPRMVDFVAAEEMERSVYTVVGDDGFPVPRAQWTAQGGRVDFRLGRDTRTIEVTMTGATGITNDSGEEMRSFSLALASDTSGSRYSTLRILGEGVEFNRRVIRFPTGVSSNLTGTEVGATIDNPFISSMGQAVQAGALAAFKFSGSAPSLSRSSLIPHQRNWGHEVLSGRILTDRHSFRVRDATYTPEGVSVTGEYALSYGDLEEGSSYLDFDTANKDLTYGDLLSKGKNIV